MVNRAPEFIGSMFIDGEHVLADPRCRLILRAALDLADAGKAIDLVTLASRLHERGEHKAAGGDEFLLGLADEFLNRRQRP